MYLGKFEIMIKNYFKIGWRNLLKNQLFSVINIGGMALSIASFLTIALFVYDEFKFDKALSDRDLKFRIYNEEFFENGEKRLGAMVPPMVAPTMMAEYPEVDYYARLLYLNSAVLFEVGDRKFTEREGGYSDPAMLRMFDLELVEGDMKTALRDHRTVAISATLARKYFENESALGKIIQISDEDFSVSAVFKDFPIHSHLQLNYLLSIETLMREIPERMQVWHWRQFHTYVKLRPGSDAAALETKLVEFAQRNAWPHTKPIGAWYVPHLMPIDKVHLYASDHLWDIAQRGNVQTVYILMATAAFILIIAILNFINLSTARAINRVKEVGVRKVVGAIRSQLIYQFISESLIIAFIALLIGGFITEVTIPFLNTFTGKSIPTGVFLNPLMILGVLLFAIFIGVAAGAYPAFYISAYSPAMILSNRKSGGSGRSMLRQALVVLQFVLSFFLIIASFVVSEQHSYMRTKDMGFQKDNLVVMPLRGEMKSNLEAAKNSFLNHPSIVSATLGYGLPGQAYAGEAIHDVVVNKDLPVSMLIVDHDYIKTLGLELIAGRDFSKDRPSDADEAFIISESAAKLFGYSDAKEALEHPVEWNRWDAPDKIKKGKIVGVVKDIHLNSLKENITPIVLHIFPFGYSTLTLKVNSDDLPSTLAFLSSTWKKFNNEWPFEYKFLDENFDKLYKAEEKLATLFRFFTAFSIVVACLGLFGLVVYSTTQKYREISIRKVLGAAEADLVLGLSRVYLYLIAVAFIIAVPISYIAAQKWLQSFAYRIEITPLLFVKAGLLILVLSLLTVGVQSLKAARSNPVDALKEQ